MAQDIDVFTRNLKQLAYGYDGSDIAGDILPVLEDLFPIADAAVSPSSSKILLLGRIEIYHSCIIRSFRIGFGALVE